MSVILMDGSESQERGKKGNGMCTEKDFFTGCSRLRGSSASISPRLLPLLILHRLLWALPLLPSISNSPVPSIQHLKLHSDF